MFSLMGTSRSQLVGAAYKSSKEIREIMIEIISYLVRSITDTYLREDLTKEVIQERQVSLYFIKIFRRFYFPSKFLLSIIFLKEELHSIKSQKAYP